MKKSLFQSVIVTVTCLFLTSSLVAQSPQGIPYQAVMRHADGTVMASSAVSLTLIIHDGTANGTVVYQESHSLTSNAQGLVSCVVGNGVVSQGNSEASLSNINWGSGAKFLHVMMGTTDLGTQQMLSVPYALYAGACDIQVSLTGDTLYTGGGNFVIIPGISAANFPPAVLGCTDNAACNYNSAATQNDNSCLYTGATCDDGNANTTNDVINGSCVCAGTAVGNGTFIPGNGTTDIDGNTYTSIIINGQEWMQQNLAVTKYRNGDPIPTGLSNSTWQNTTNGAYAIYNNDAANNTLYGKLYNWYAVNDTRGLCPSGWHVPSDGEWSTLINYLDPSANGGDTWPNVAGGKLKSTTGWNSPNEGATNESGFTGLPGGYRLANGTYNSIGNYGGWWSSTEYDSYIAWNRELYYNFSYVGRYDYSKRYGFSVRCVRD
jgi:uncharacterized protein (TIGR02145 family)